MITYFKIRSFLFNAVEVEWEADSFYSRFDISSSADGVVFTTIKEIEDGTARSAIISIVDLPSVLHNMFRLTAYTQNGGHTTYDLTVDVQRICPPDYSPVACGPDGSPRLLKVDDGGNLLVSGITINSTGHGDASASLQTQQLSSLNAISTTSTSILGAVNAVTNKLSDVRITSTQVADLKNVTVINFPTDYPDLTTSAILNQIKSLIATESSMAVALSLLAQLLKKTDLDLNASGKLGVIVDNVPADYPSVELLSALNTAISKLDSVITGVGLSLASTDSIGNVSADINSNVETALSHMEAIQSSILTNISDDLTAINSTLTATSTDYAKDSTLLGMSDKLDTALKTADIPKSIDGDILVEVKNIPTDYPDFIANQTLSDIKTKVDTLDLSNVTISSPLPAGTNVIGQVEVLAAPLPENAAKDTTLVGVYTKLDNIYAQIISSNPGTIKSLLVTLAVKLDAIKSTLIAQNEAVILYESSSTDALMPLQTRTSGSVANESFGEVLVSAVIASPLGAKMSISSSMNGIEFYPINGYSTIELTGNKLHIIKVPNTLRYVKVDLINASQTSPIEIGYIGISKQA